jgi:GxxExxY protein
LLIIQLTFNAETQRTQRNAEEKEMHENDISERVIGAAIEVHRILGPGLLENVYEEALCHEFHLREIRFERQKPVPIAYKGVKLATDLRLDLLVEDKIIVDTKAKEKMTDIDFVKTLTYMRLTGKRLGLNINFHEPRLVDGVQRIVNHLD